MCRAWTYCSYIKMAISGLLYIFIFIKMKPTNWNPWSWTHTYTSKTIYKSNLFIENQFVHDVHCTMYSTYILYTHTNAFESTIKCSFNTWIINCLLIGRSKSKEKFLFTILQIRPFWLYYTQNIKYFIDF